MPCRLGEQEQLPLHCRYESAHPQSIDAALFALSGSVAKNVNPKFCVDKIS
jgi:hypothetical protein